MNHRLFSYLGKATLPALTFLIISLSTGCLPSAFSERNSDKGIHADTHGHGDHDHEHEDEEEHQSITEWIDNVEVFAQFDFLHAGSPQEIILHLTDLSTGLPVKKGELRYRAELEKTGASIQGTGVLKKAGIFLIEPTFSEGGEWELHLDTPLGPVSLDDLDVHGMSEEHDHDHDHGHASDAHQHEIVFSKEQQWVLPLRTALAHEGPLAERYSFQASVLTTPESRSAVSAPVNGILNAPASGSFPKIGDYVEANQELARVLPTTMSDTSLAHESNLQNLYALRAELSAQAAQAAADATAARARALQSSTALERATGLFEIKAGAKRDVEEAQSALVEAQAAERAANERAALSRKALKELSETTFQPSDIYSPIAGRITSISEGVGNYIDAGSIVFEVVNTEELLIEAQVPEIQVTKLAQSPTCMAELPSAPGELIVLSAANDGAPWLQPYVNEERRTISLLLPVLNPEGLLRLGMTLTLWVEGRSTVQTLMVPASAVLDDNGVQTLYIMHDGECFEKRLVRTGINDGIWIEILDGVTAGERVVSSGAYAVRLAGLAGSGLGSAHVH